MKIEPKDTLDEFSVLHKFGQSLINLGQAFQDKNSKIEDLAKLAHAAGFMLQIRLGEPIVIGIDVAIDDSNPSTQRCHDE